MLLPTLLLALTAGQQHATPPLAITHVTVLPMDTERRLVDHTVIVAGDRIVAVGPSEDLAVPEGARVIDGQGQFLMPGLVDFHVHTYFETDHELFLANGVTTVRNLFGNPMHLALRGRLERGELLGPTLLTAGPIVDGDPPIWPGSTVITDPARARAAVKAQADAGYDFIKVYQQLQPAAYDAIVAAAEEFGLPVMGHVPTAVGLEHVLASGQRTLEHLFGYELLLQPDDAPPIGDDFQARFAAWSAIDVAKLPPLAKATRAAGVWNCPTLVVLLKRLTDQQIEQELALPHMQYVPAGQRGMWRGMNRGTEQSKLACQAGDAGRKAVVRGLHEAGCGILLGTDMGNPFVAPGFAVHEELGHLVDAGLSPYEALKAGTYNPAACLEATEEFGSVQPGRRADLVLLANDPFQDVAHAARPEAVCARGRWLDREALDAMLKSLANQR